MEIKRAFRFRGGPGARAAGGALLLAAALAQIGCGGAASADASAPLVVFGRTGAGPLEFNYPRAAALDALGRLFVVDKAGRVQRIARAGAFELDWRTPAVQAGRPIGIGIGPDGRVYLADTHYSRVLIYDSDGNLSGQFGANGDGPGQFRMPTDVAFGLDGAMYVSEYGGNDRVSKFSAAGEYLLSFGGLDAGEARLSRPQGLLLAPDGGLWVADSCNHRICRFGPGGEWIAAFGRVGDGLGELRYPYSVDMLSNGDLVVCEFGGNRVQRFTPQGRSLGVWGGPGRAVGQLAYPWAAVVDQDDRVYVIDSGNNRVQVIDGRAPQTWKAE